MEVLVQDNIDTTELRKFGTFTLYSPITLKQKEKSVEDLVQLYNQIKDDIDKRLDEFDVLWDEGSHREVFREMAFCMCTPQTNAKYAWNAVQRLDELDYLENGKFEEIAHILKESGVRFHKNKTKYIMNNRRNFFFDTKDILLKMFNGGDIIQMRNKLAETVVGWGMKEASHFLRNIGHGQKICILDRHILRQLSEYGVIAKIPKLMTKGDYLAIETDMRHFAKEVDIPLEALDMVFWYKAKGELFK